ncbi:class I SAM-dependent methyltransferase [Pseudoroseicyclus tamaricis]|uniref:Methyltransferase domain-containing protein n=1 Tax=Pseudoroseicyclus tamaricis TaxID=2705421 RepID=A0A6B2JNM6_9RHOB|nr:class I SAM-dependent methyltransferase [Pseudoroseicyclus tamaricis]NDU99637.1 methyltransferase domain-containing protein [Pseudoroseicyclus tamaricis]
MPGPEEAQYATPANLTARGDLHARYASEDWFGFVHDKIGLTSGETVLDIGCGAGWIWEREGLPEIALTLADRSPAMVEAALGRAKVADTHGEVADAASLGFAAGQFDVILALHMAYHLENPAEALAQMAPLLKEGGRLVLSVNGTGNLGPLWNIAAECLGIAPVDPSVVLFSDLAAEAALAATFREIERHDFVDLYRVAEAEPLVAYLASLPPAAEGGAAALPAIRTSVEDALARGPLELPRRSAVLVARAPKQP